jgi:hypothetical protein
MATSYLCPRCKQWHLASLKCERTALARYQENDAREQDNADVAEAFSIARYLLDRR